MSWYQLKIDMDGDTFMVTSPDFPEVTTFGCDIPSALSNGRDAIEEAIAARIAEAEPLPVPSLSEEGPGYHVQLSTLSILKVALYSIAKMQEVSRAELARRLGWHREQVDRLFRLDHNSRLDQLEAAFDALGLSLQSAFDVSNLKAA